jgi:hypothetical protein
VLSVAVMASPNFVPADDEMTAARRVFLFSGHMIDSPDRERPRFPADREALAVQAINGVVSAFGINDGDLAICGGACGGDLIFAEAVLLHGCRLHLYLPLNEAEFLHNSVAFAGASWVARYRRVKANPLVQMHEQTDELPAKDTDPYVRNNFRQLCAALSTAAETMHLIALWDGESSTADGGTRSMVETVRKFGGHVKVIDARALFKL